VGDVPRGVFLDQRPIFLGGQGGLVGPARIAFGSVVAAGGICRRDLLEENQLCIPKVPRGGTRNYEMGVYRKIDRIVESNLAYIGNILALREWYRKVRGRYMAQDKFSLCCLEGAMQNLDLVLAERIKRLGDLAAKMEYSFQWLEAHGGDSETIAMQKSFLVRWPQIKEHLERSGPVQEFQSLEVFLGALPSKGNYLEIIQSLEPATREVGRAWLQSIVDGAVSC
jgi:UDP-N-acetylglucosamine/UDP-N-acetylgalactosamine diphosphorylase